MSIVYFQEYIYCYNVFIVYFSGDLLPRHVQIFSTNSFFKGMIIPEPERLVSTLCFSQTFLCNGQPLQRTEMTFEINDI